jgi:hypothetical protein
VVLPYLFYLFSFDPDVKSWSGSYWCCFPAEHYGFCFLIRDLESGVVCLFGYFIHCFLKFYYTYAFCLCVVSMTQSSANPIICIGSWLTLYFVTWLLKIMYLWYRKFEFELIHFSLFLWCHSIILFHSGSFIRQ